MLELQSCRTKKFSNHSEGGGGVLPYLAIYFFLVMCHPIGYDIKVLNT